MPVYAWHWDALRVWGKVWRRWLLLLSPTGKVQRRGLDLDQVNAALAGLAIPRRRWPEIHRQLDVMESAALEALSEQN